MMLSPASRSGTRRWVGLLAAASIVAATEAAAETIDLAATTCAELTTSSNAARRFFVFWFDGYLAARRGRTVSDGDEMERRLGRVMKACETDGAQKVMQLMEAADAK